MATQDERPREQVILDALVRELAEQDVSDVTALDLQRLALAIDSALVVSGSDDDLPPEIEGFEPDELNAANDS
jgi:hypothetical protein